MRDTSDRTLVPAGPIREHVRALIASGVSSRTIRSATGIAVDELAYGVRVNGELRHQRHVLASTARILAAFRPTLDDYPDSVNIDGRGTRRRLRALAAMGYSFAAVARQIGHHERSIVDTAHSDQVLAATARAVRDAYEHLSARPPVGATAIERAAIAQCKRRARDKGWHGPLAWDDIDTDPELPPQTFESDEEEDLTLDVIALIEQYQAGYQVHLVGEERRRMVLALAERDYSQRDIARITGSHDRQVHRILHAAAAPATSEVAAA